MYISKLLKKSYIVISTILLMCILAGTGIYAMEAFEDANTKQVDVDVPIAMNLTSDLQMEPSERRNLNEPPIYIARAIFSVVASGKLKGYTLKKEVKLYRDLACEEEIPSGVDIEIEDSTTQVAGEHEIFVKLHIQDRALAGETIYVKLFVSLEK